MDNPEQLTCLSLCTGYGGIELGLERAGVCLRPVAYVEREAFAAANMVAKIEAGEVAPAPVWTDVKTFPYADFHGRVGIMLAGYPCQPFSAAGQRKGAADERHLWPYIADGIAACQPRLVFCENVEGHLSLGIKDVFNDLDRLGYSYTAGLFSAEEVGATHRRKRLFWLAYSDRNGNTRPRNILGQIGEIRQRREDIKKDSLVSTKKLANPNDSGSGENIELPELWPTGIKQSSRGAWQTSGKGKTSKVTKWPAGPKQPQHGWEEPRTVSKLDGTTHGPRSRPDAIANRVDRLRLLGNGVVPQTAEKAFTTLWQQLKN